jgi:hypothetical protein
LSDIDPTTTISLYRVLAKCVLIHSFLSQPLGPNFALFPGPVRELLLINQISQVNAICEAPWFNHIVYGLHILDDIPSPDRTTVRTLRTIASSLTANYISQAGLGTSNINFNNLTLKKLNGTIALTFRYRGGGKDSREKKIGSIVKMDVTSLLNSNPAAAEQRKRADSGSSKGPSRSRTPWDAGGYSLPINTATNGSKSPQKQSQSEYRRDDVPISTPPLSPKHRFSDSRSSLSSFTSSLLSTATHSRFSSTSTLNSNSHAHHKSFSTDIISPELRSISQTLEYAIQPLVIDSCQTNQTRQVPSLSPTGSPLQQLAIVAETHLSGQKSESSSGNNDAMQTDSTEAADSITIPALHNRPGSPSDAILIKRTSIPSLRVNTEDLSGYRQQ